MSGITDGELAGIYREADARLLEQIRDQMAKRGLKPAIVRSDREIGTAPARYILLVKVDRIELGGRRPFGRTAKDKVIYSLQSKDRFDLVKRTHEETSAQKWQNCVKKISEQLAADVADDIGRNAAPRTEDRQDRARQAPAAAPASAPAPVSPESRLQQLEHLKAQGLIRQEEYEAKRQEILKEL
jgi:hypothetical protein